MFVVKVGKLYVSEVDYDIDSQGGFIFFSLNLKESITDSFYLDKGLAKKISKYTGGKIYKIKLEQIY